MIANFDEEERTDAAKCLIFPTWPTADSISELVLHLSGPLDVRLQQYKCDKKNLVSMDKALVIVDEAGSSNDRDIHHLLNGNLNVTKLHCQSQ
ncbi:unnamed protein product [Bursaphelenchus xylophilus]|uniref:(pine wood nematode) hypothetical protein n=1 Tax=Bursaphelenchus xylophilus TaxID=6326 RepID=A0A7I8X7N2_BURXY|nr:unnamed protein product [Bursaphelenchus xylophilus]CAG9125883.1 unnamed protein product [Bursaphelenchus xylophilus]